MEVGMQEGQVEPSTPSVPMSVEFRGRFAVIVPAAKLPELTPSVVRTTLERVRR